MKKKGRQIEIISEETIAHLHTVFITPIDRDEIIGLSTSINRIIHSMEKINAHIYYCSMRSIDVPTNQSIGFIQEAVHNLRQIFNHVITHKINRQYVANIKTIEKKADTIYRNAMMQLFKKKKDAIELIKCKTLYELAEDTIDDIKHMADTIESVIINNS